MKSQCFESGPFLVEITYDDNQQPSGVIVRHGRTTTAEFYRDDEQT